MPDLNFCIDSAEAVRYAAVPTLAFRLHVTNATPDQAVHAVALRCQIRIEPTRRHYQGQEIPLLRDLFGEPERWSQTLKSMLWTHAETSIPAFDDEVSVDLPVPCSFDFNVAATKYFHALESGEVPLSFLFSGSIFYRSALMEVQVARVPWVKEADFNLPVGVWREMMDLHYPNTAWLSLQRDVFDRLYRLKIDQGIPTWEQTLERLLDRAEERS